jgi:hypothetical protein
MPCLAPLLMLRVESAFPGRREIKQSYRIHSGSKFESYDASNLEASVHTFRGPISVPVQCRLQTADRQISGLTAGKPS